MIAVVVYLAAIVAANLLVATFGPGISIVNAFVFVGLDLTLRDRLHDAWSGRGLRARMAALIATGGAISWIVNAAAAQIAIASTIAFVVAASLDALTYAMLDGRPRLVRVNASNVVASIADSILFPTIAFGAVLPGIILGQIVAKIGGGFVWSLLLVRRRTFAEPEPWELEYQTGPDPEVDR